MTVRDHRIRRNKEKTRGQHINIRPAATGRHTPVSSRNKAGTKQKISNLPWQKPSQRQEPPTFFSFPLGFRTIRCDMVGWGQEAGEEWGARTPGSFTNPATALGPVDRSLLSFDLHNFLFSLPTPHFVAPTSACPFAWLIPTHPWGLRLNTPSSRRKSSLTYSSLGCKCPQCGDHGCLPRTQS